MKRVLIIAYYWPPAGGGGVQRWLKFVKYLPGQGWTPVVYTAENADYPVFDASLESEIPPEAEVIRHPIWEPYRSIRNVSSGSDRGIAAGFIRKKGKAGMKEKLMGWVRGNLVIPDARRFWIAPSVRFLTDYLKRHPVDVIVSTGPPHSMHLIALNVARKTGIPWLADFRDPWVNMDNADKFRMTRLARAAHERMERRVLRSADAVVTVSWYLSAQYALIRARPVGVITNGFDHADFSTLAPVKRNQFVIGHYGTFGDDRNPVELWNALDDLTREDPGFARDLQLELIGPTDGSVLEDAGRRQFGDRIVHIPYMGHDEVILRMKSASVLLVILNQNANEEGRVTGKIFEYVACARPVLGIGSTTSDCARVIRESECGKMVSFSDKKEIIAFIREVYEGRFHPLSRNAESVMQYSRKELTRQLAGELDILRESGR